MFSILADIASQTATTGSDALLAGLVGSIGGTGFSVWYGWYVTTKAIPRIVCEHRDERKADRAERLAMHETFSAGVKELTAAINSLPCRLRT